MEIIERGRIPHYKYKFKCDKCKTVYLADEEEIEERFFYDCELFSEKCTVCPVCSNVVINILFTKKIKCFEEE